MDNSFILGEEFGIIILNNFTKADKFEFWVIWINDEELEILNIVYRLHFSWFI